MATDTIVFNKECVYQYRLGEVGQSVSFEGLYKHIEDLIFVVERLISFYIEKIGEKRISNTYNKKYIRWNYRVLLPLMRFIKRQF